MWLSQTRTESSSINGTPKKRYSNQIKVMFVFLLLITCSSRALFCSALKNIDSYTAKERLVGLVVLADRHWVGNPHQYGQHHLSSNVVSALFCYAYYNKGLYNSTAVFLRQQKYFYPPQRNCANRIYHLKMNWSELENLPLFLPCFSFDVGLAYFFAVV